MKSNVLCILILFTTILFELSWSQGTMSGFTTMTTPMTMTMTTPMTMTMTAPTMNCPASCVPPAGTCVMYTMCICNAPYLGIACQFKPSKSKVYSESTTSPIFNFKRGKYNVTIGSLEETGQNVVHKKVDFGSSVWEVKKYAPVEGGNVTYSYTTDVKNFGETCKLNLNATIISANITASMTTIYDTSVYFLANFSGCDPITSGNFITLSFHVSVDSYTGYESSIIISNDDALGARSISSNSLSFSQTNVSIFTQTAITLDNSMDIFFTVLESAGEHYTDSSFADSTTGGSSSNIDSSSSNSKSESNGGTGDSNSETTSQTTSQTTSESTTPSTSSPTSSTTTSSTSTSPTTSSTGTISNPEEVTDPNSSIALCFIFIDYLFHFSLSFLN